jgi:hypothetical protein
MWIPRESLRSSNDLGSVLVLGLFSLYLVCDLKNEKKIIYLWFSFLSIQKLQKMLHLVMHFCLVVVA